jgi:NAD-dependent deacetylase
MSELNTDQRVRIKKAANLISESQHAVVLSGAGISTPSGIPDFRSEGSGLWTRYDPMEVASLRVFRYHPEKFFAWMRSLALLIFQADPNAAHLALARLEQAGYIETVITQNIDGLHRRAGSQHVLEVHGSLQTLTCIGCYHQYESSGFIEPYLENGDIPHCPNCKDILKPDAVLFEEQLPYRTWLQAEQAIKSCDLLLVTGSSLEVLPVAGLPMRALENKAHLIIVNQTPTYIDDRADLVFNEDVADIIPQIAEEVLGE